MERGVLPLTNYENILEQLKSPSFSENSLGNPEFKKNLISTNGEHLNIQVESFESEKNGGCPLEYIMNHIHWRFLELEKKMERDIRIKVTIPGESSTNHALGEPYRSDWKWVDRKNSDKLEAGLRDYITAKLKKMEKKFGERVRYGEVLYANANETSYQVWSANAANWNLPDGDEIPGKFQAQEMKFQGPGVYGIVVTPLYGYHDLVPEEYEK